MSKITHNGHDVLRTAILRPYRKGTGPTFYLAVWDTGQRHARGTTVLGYCLKQGTETIFEGEDFSPSPMDAIDSDACLAALLGFLAVCPDDIDREYFAALGFERGDGSCVKLKVPSGRTDDHAREGIYVPTR